MSSSTKTDLALVLDNRVNVSAESTGLVRISGVNTNYFNVPADGSSFPTQIQFNNIVTPSLTSTMVSRNIRILYRIQVAYATNGANALPTLCMPNSFYQPNYQVNSMLRAFPLQSCVDAMSLIINGATTTINSRQVLSAIQRVISKDYLRNQGSEVPSMADNRAVLIADTVQTTGSWTAGAGYPGNGTVVNVAFSNGWAGTFTAGAAYPAAGTFVPVVITGKPQYYAYWIAGTAYVANAVNPVFIDQDCHSEQPLSKYEASCGTTRASFKAISYLNDQTGGNLPAGNWDVYLFEVSEPLLISPLVLHDDETFLSNINTLSLQINYAQLADSICNAGSVVGFNPASLNVQISSTTTPVLELTYIQVDPAIVQIPRAVSYHYENVVYYPKTTGSLDLCADGFRTYSLSSDTIRFQTMPSLIYVFARLPISTRNVLGNQADTFLGIGDNSGNANISIQIGTRTGLLASASTKTIYRMSKRNGYNSSWEDFSQGSGALLVLNPVEDLGVNIEAGDVVPGEASGNVNFQINMMVNNGNYQYAGANSAIRNAQGVPTGQQQLELMIVAVYSGTATITPDGCLYNLGELSPAEVSTLVAKAPRDGSMVSSEMIKPTVQGGSLFSKFKSILGKTASGVSSVIDNPMFRQGLGYASKLAGGRLRR
jgi:hypothetical protein